MSSAFSTGAASRAPFVWPIDRPMQKCDMEFRFNEEERSFAEAVSRSLANICPLSSVRELMRDGRGAVHVEAWRALADLGVLAAAIPERSGGRGAGPIMLAAAAESIGAHLAPVPLASSIYLCALTLAEVSPDDSHLPALGRGDTIGAVVFDGQVEVAGAKAHGFAELVFDGAAATHALVLARDDYGRSTYVIDLRSHGVAKRPRRTIDASKPAIEVQFEGVHAYRVGPAGSGQDIRARAERRGAILAAFEQIGGASAALNKAFYYARERVAFGKPIGAQQAVKHLLADAWASIEVARGHAYHALVALDRSRPDLALAAYAARSAAARAYLSASRACLQVHGGGGFAWASDPHLFYRRARALSSLFGSDQERRRRIAAALFDGARPYLQAWTWTTVPTKPRFEFVRETGWSGMHGCGRTGRISPASARCPSRRS